jgi:hypothetical protein
VDFDAVLTMLPGELDPDWHSQPPPNCAVQTTTPPVTTRRYGGQTDSFYSAAFGLARLRARAGERAGAVATLDQITTASAHYTAAGTAAIEILLDGRTCDNLDEPTLLDAGKRASTLTLESATKRATIRLKVLGARWIGSRRVIHEGCGFTAPNSTRRVSAWEWSTRTARWRTRQPTWSASLWWRRQMRSGLGPGYELRGGEVYALRCERRACRAIL